MKRRFIKDHRALQLAVLTVVLFGALAAVLSGILAGCVFIPPSKGNEVLAFNADNLPGRPSSRRGGDDSEAGEAPAAAQASSGSSLRSPRRRRKPRLLESENPCERESERHKCRRQCENIYGWRSHRADCRKLDPERIERLEELHKAIASADDEDLEDIAAKDLEIYLYISTEAFIEQAARHEELEAGEILKWIAGDHEAAEVIAAADGDYLILHELLKALSRPVYERHKDDWHCVSNNADMNTFLKYCPYAAFRAPLDEWGRHRLMREALVSKNEAAAEYFYRYIQDLSCQGESEISCFTHFCEIGASISRKDLRKRWRKFDFFESYIEKIIRDGTNSVEKRVSDGWSASEIEDIGDINNWFCDLKCASPILDEEDFNVPDLCPDS